MSNRGLLCFFLESLHTHELAKPWDHKMQDYYADEVGVLSPSQLQVDTLYAGEVEILSYFFWY